jgi:hypothetical protein
MGVHGVSVTELTEGTRPVAVNSPSAIGLVGSATAATGLDVGETKVVRSEKDVRDLGLNETSSLARALAGIFLQTKAAVVVHRVEHDADPTDLAINVAGIASEGSGVWAFTRAAADVGVVPKILIAPGVSHVAAVYGALVAVANRLRAVALLDGPSTTDAEVIALAGSVSDPKGRAYLVDPHVVVHGEAVPASPYAAGVIARTDQERGWWSSPSNQPVVGLDGLARPIGFALGDASSQAQTLNAAKVATIIRQDGWRLWGNRGLGTEPITAFLSVRRTADVVAESIQRAHLWAVDRGITFNLIESIVESTNGFLRSLKAQGAIIDGEAWADPELNTVATLANGELFVDYKFTAVYPAESIQFRQHLTTEFLDQIVQ